MSNLKQAYELWKYFQPADNKDCCHNKHHYANGVVKPDNLVCDREKAWRQVVRIRDCDSGFMMGYTR